MSIVEATRSMVQEYMRKFDPSHDMHHIDRVCRMALHLANTVDADMEVVELAALCHDIGDHKYDMEAQQTRYVERFLQELQYPKAKLVARIVDHIGYTKEKKWDDAKDDPEEVAWRNSCAELHVVQDADKLDAIGAFGILRCAAYSGAKNRVLFVPEGSTDSALQHFDDKLFHLHDMMRTSRGREIARERHEFMRLFVDQVHKEYMV